MFTKVDSMKLVGFTDSDWAGSIDDMKSTSRYLFTFGSTFLLEFKETIHCCSINS